MNPLSFAMIRFSNKETDILVCGTATATFPLGTPVFPLGTLRQPKSLFILSQFAQYELSTRHHLLLSIWRLHMVLSGMWLERPMSLRREALDGSQLVAGVFGVFVSFASRFFRTASTRPRRV